jgi:hypothetical protein
MKLNNEEYSEFRWVAVDELLALEPKIPTIPDMVTWALSLKNFARPQDFTDI